MKIGKLLVVVLNWNGGDCVLKTLNSFVESIGYKEFFDVVVFDNASSDNSFEQIRSCFLDIKAIRLPRNLFWSGGNNKAIDYAIENGYEYIFFANHDLEVPNFWAQLLREVELPDNLGCLGFDVVGEYSRSSYSIYLNKCSSFVDSLNGVSLKKDDWISGCALIIPVRHFLGIGYFDDIYKLYSEEDDFLVRLRLAGLATLRSSIPMWHFSELSSRNLPFFSAYMAIRNSIRLKIKFPARPFDAFRHTARLTVRACFPFQGVDEINSVNRRFRPSSNIFINFSLWIKAVAWNVLHFSETKSLAREHRQKAITYGLGLECDD